MKTTLQGTNLELSPGLREFVDRKVDEAFRVLGDMNLDPVMVDIELEETTNKNQDRANQKKFRAEVNVKVPGRLIRVEESAADIEQAIVELKNTLTRELRKWHERMIDRSRKGAREAKAKFGTAIGEAPKDVNEWEEWDEDEIEEAAQALRASK